MGNQLTGIAPSQILPVEHYLTDVPDYEFDLRCVVHILFWQNYVSNVNGMRWIRCRNGAFIDFSPYDFRNRHLYSNLFWYLHEKHILSLGRISPYIKLFLTTAPLFTSLA